MASKDKELHVNINHEGDPLLPQNISSTKLKSVQHRRKTVRYLLLLLLIVAALIILLAVVLGVGLRTTPLYKRIKAANLMQHLRDLDAIAENHPSGSRAVQYAYNESAEMIHDKLTDAGYEVFRQYFRVGVYENLGYNALSITVSWLRHKFEMVEGKEFSVLRYSGSTDWFWIEGDLDVIQGSGCSASAYSGQTVAVVDYPNNASVTECSLFEMASAATSANVYALVMSRREDDENRSIPPSAAVYKQTTDNFTVVDIPLIGTTYHVGSLMRDFINEGTTINVRTRTRITIWNTYNILAYTSKGKDDSIIVLGSHLDSVPAGPGINDDGSGSSANLELALQIARHKLTPVNKVLFAFWGAEELGLMGSYHFIDQMAEEGQLKNIALNLNLDMVGSPNFVRKVFNGSSAENTAVVNGSVRIQHLFEDYFMSRKLSYECKSFNGGSDYYPFIQEGVDIPAGGVATGAGEIKSSDETMAFGGQTGVQLDPCYHKSCDTIDNINQEVIEQMTQATASVLETLMMKKKLRGFLQQKSSQ